MSVGFFRLFLSLYTYKRPPRPSGTPQGRGRNTASNRNFTKRKCIFSPTGGDVAPPWRGQRGFQHKHNYLQGGRTTSNFGSLNLIYYFSIFIYKYYLSK